jgi:hypothetical protein
VRAGRAAVCGAPRASLDRRAEGHGIVRGEGLEAGPGGGATSDLR